MNNLSIGAVRIPDSKLAQAATELVRDTESDLRCPNNRKSLIANGLLKIETSGITFS
jgi:hypothetical protein